MQIPREEFDKRFDAVLDKLDKLDTPEQFQKRISEFTNDNNQLSLYDTVALLRSESKLYANTLMYHLLREFFVDSHDR